MIVNMAYIMMRLTEKLSMTDLATFKKVFEHHAIKYWMRW